MLEEKKTRKTFRKTNISYSPIRARTCAYQGVKMFVFWKIWRTLFPWNTRFEIRPFVLLPTNYCCQALHLRCLRSPDNISFYYGNFDMMRILKNGWSCSYNFRNIGRKTPVLESLFNIKLQALCWSLFLIKLQALRPVTLLKPDSNAGALL